MLAFSDAVPATISDNAREAEDKPELGPKDELKPEEEEGEEEDEGENEEGDEEQINSCQPSTTDPPVSLTWGKVLAVLTMHRRWVLFEHLTS